MSAKMTPQKATKSPTRTVKISDEIHHKIRVISVQKRTPMQEFIETLLTRGLRRYEKLVPETEVAA
jgi:hypothetical protein